MKKSRFLTPFIIGSIGMLAFTGCTGNNGDGPSDFSPDKVQEIVDKNTATEDNLDELANLTNDYIENEEVWDMMEPGDAKYPEDDPAPRDTSFDDLADPLVKKTYTLEAATDVEQTKFNILDYLEENADATEFPDSLIVNRYPDLIDSKIMTNKEGVPFIVQKPKSSPSENVYYVIDDDVDVTAPEDSDN